MYLLKIWFWVVLRVSKFFERRTTSIVKCVKYTPIFPYKLAHFPKFWVNDKVKSSTYKVKSTIHHRQGKIFLKQGKKLHNSIQGEIFLKQGEKFHSFLTRSNLPQTRWNLPTPCPFHFCDFSFDLICACVCVRERERCFPYRDLHWEEAFVVI